MSDRSTGIVVVWALAAACVSPAARARDIDPATVTSLTVAEARQLSQTKSELSLPRLASLTPEVAAALVKEGYWYDLHLDGVASLSPEAARALARHECGLHLAGLERIAADVAVELGRGGGHLTRLSLPLPPGTPAESLRGLARVEHDLEFVGPVAITADFADAFARFGYEITLSGSVTPLDPDVAEKLTFPGKLRVPGPIELTDDVAAVLATRAGDTWITGLTAISPGVARMLAGRREIIDFDRLLTLDSASAAVLATYAGPAMYFSALQSLSPEAARALAAFRGRLAVMSPQDLRADVVAILAAQPSWLDLGIETLTPEVAAALARHEGRLGLCCVRSLPPEVAEILAANPGHIGLQAIQNLEPATAAALAGHRGNLDLRNVKSCPPESATALMGLEGELNLDYLPQLDDRLAEVFATRRGGLLLLRHVGKMTPAAPETLARNPLVRFDEGWLRTLSPEAAAGLAQWPENLELGGVESLSSEAAAALARHERRLSLLGLTSLDGPDATDVARTLAAKRGPLVVPRLKRITVGALTALAEKADIVVPPLGTLEIVPDHPGGATDDFVLPTDFLNRQRGP